MGSSTPRIENFIMPFLMASHFRIFPVVKCIVGMFYGLTLIIELWLDYAASAAVQAKEACLCLCEQCLSWEAYLLNHVHPLQTRSRNVCIQVPGYVL